MAGLATLEFYKSTAKCMDHYLYTHTHLHEHTLCLPLLSTTAFFILGLYLKYTMLQQVIIAYLCSIQCLF